MNCGNEVKMKKWSSQWTQFMQLRKDARKKFRTSTGFEPVTSRLPVRCSTNWAMKPLTLGAGQLWVHMFPWKKWVLVIYEINHLWTAKMKWQWRNRQRICCHVGRSKTGCCYHKGLLSSRPKVTSPKVMSPKIRVMSPIYHLSLLFRLIEDHRTRNVFDLSRLFWLLIQG